MSKSNKGRRGQDKARRIADNRNRNRNRNQNRNNLEQNTNRALIPLPGPCQMDAAFSGTGLQFLPAGVPGEAPQQYHLQQFRPAYASESGQAIEAVQARMAKMAMRAHPGAQQGGQGNPLQGSASNAGASNISLSSQALQPRNTVPQGLQQGSHQLAPPVSSGSALPSGVIRPLPPVYKVPNCFPTYFSYAAQHILLSGVQNLLEETCFDFAKRWVPGLLARNGWDVAVAGELSAWPEELHHYRKDIPPQAIDSNASSGRSPADIVNDVRKLRNIVVHREPTKASGVLDMLQSALTVTKAFKDAPRTADLQVIIDLVTQNRDEIASSKDRLEDRLTTRLQKFQDDRDAIGKRIRAILDQIDELTEEISGLDRQAKVVDDSAQSAIADVHREDTDMRKDASKRLAVQLQIVFPKPNLEDAMKLVFAPHIIEDHRRREANRSNDAFSAEIDTQSGRENKDKPGDQGVSDKLHTTVGSKSAGPSIEQQKEQPRNDSESGQHNHIPAVHSSGHLDTNLLNASNSVETENTGLHNPSMLHEDSGRSTLLGRHMSPPRIGSTSGQLEGSSTATGSGGIVLSTQRGGDFIDLTAEDSDDNSLADDDEPQMFLRKRTAPCLEQPPSKRPKLEERDSKM